MWRVEEARGGGGLSGPVRVRRSERRLRGRKRVPSRSFSALFFLSLCSELRSEVQIHCQSEREWMKEWMNGGEWGRVREGREQHVSNVPAPCMCVCGCSAQIFALKMWYLELKFNVGELNFEANLCYTHFTCSFKAHSTPGWKKNTQSNHKTSVREWN